MSEKMIFTSRIVLKIGILSDRIRFSISFDIQVNHCFSYIWYISVISDLLNNVCIYLRLCTMGRFFIFWCSRYRMGLCYAIMSMGDCFCMRQLRYSMHNSHISKKKYSKKYTNTDEFFIKKYHRINLSICDTEIKGKLFSGSNIPSPNQFFDKIFFFFSFRGKSLCPTTREVIFEKFTICTLQ